MEIFVESDSGAAAAAAESKGFTFTAKRGVSFEGVESQENRYFHPVSHFTNEVSSVERV